MTLQGTKNKSVLCALITALGFWLAAPLALAVVFSGETQVFLSGSNITLTLASGEMSYSVDSSTLMLNLVSGSSVMVKSSNLDTLTNSQSLPTLCSGTSYSYVSFSAATTTTVSLTPTTTAAC